MVWIPHKLWIGDAARSREAASKRKYCDLHKMMRIV